MSKLHPKAAGIALGAVMAVGLFVVTAIILVPGGGAGNTLGKLGHVFIGYDPSQPSGLIVGPVYAFFSGMVMGWIFATVYNKALAAEQSADSEEQEQGKES